ncbi:respiratory nitrate reductase subunit gamma [Fredinandcohnia humi]
MMMNLLDMILWVVFPYTVIFVFITWMIWKSEYQIRLKQVKYIFLVVLFLFVGSGSVILITIQTDYPLVLKWTKGFLTLNPSMDLMYMASPFTQIHILSLFILLLLLPFTGITFQKHTILQMEDEDASLITKW